MVQTPKNRRPYFTSSRVPSLNFNSAPRSRLLVHGSQTSPDTSPSNSIRSSLDPYTFVVICTSSPPLSTPLAAASRSHQSGRRLNGYRSTSGEFLGLRIGRE